MLQADSPSAQSNQSSKANAAIAILLDKAIFQDPVKSTRLLHLFPDILHSV